MFQSGNKAFSMRQICVPKPRASPTYFGRDRQNKRLFIFILFIFDSIYFVSTAVSLCQSLQICTRTYELSYVCTTANGLDEKCLAKQNFNV